ncbi:uncharacterized protein LOC127846658 isoform X8 [Dreissena polymorpha]|uniref:uncharacterized protein LOC127846658 isoform X1 n=1 Tax=Dreissena polymorpha TaxID=45954 RepID=UPI0022645A69|nr:uncharacterized protein LOC127846658 isoform X1 [Dreissena polymorpha]XP_052234055.1 uncharacterized protein LOC127846658 isoform X2 [Dreissena polymorpha]XP_052234057.1 uncharacterized protein LOC127846658 isoform X3 [Dreissena polymorpha]XP_052234058.1 uncharacterized protein LOC127846658 isoform X1 [Dreissena polymorpha]XP_052234059.1 uncharacterized protein LOC127846658 isoform X4 [Dreissena polymorpha]XP_052234060.1 uncharacterized protein LOC127846658 isoform X1 [Dreissena polymorpha]
MANISELRNTLAAAITCGEETKGPIIQILVTDLPLRKKFDCVDFCQLLQNNSQSVASVKSLLQGLSILEKYGRHLLKPSESRSSLWTQIKFSNSIFRERVDTIEGGRDIMHKLGYTLEKPDSLCFPPNTEPDHGRVLNIVLDLAIGRKELEMYLEGQHPHPHYVEAFLTQQFRSQLSGRSSQPAPGNLSMAQPMPSQALPRFEPGRGPVPGTHDERAQPMPASAQPGQRSARLDQGRVPTPAVLDENNTGAACAPQSMIIPNDHGASRSDDPAIGTQSLMPNMVGRSNQHFQQEKLMHLNSSLFMGNSMMTGPPNGTPNQTQQSHLDTSVPNLVLQQQQQHQIVQHQQSPSNHANSLFQQNVTDQSAHLLQTQQGQFNQSNPAFQPHNSNQSQNMLHHQQPNKTSQSNDNPVPALPGYHVSLTAPMEFPPNRQPPGEYHGARPKQPPSPGPEPAGLVPSSANVEVPQSPGTVCEICGYNQAEVLCQDQMCANKMLCMECNTKWHSHPKRTNHKVERLHPLTSPRSAPAPDRQQSDDGNTQQPGENQYRQSQGRILGGNSMTGYGLPQHGVQNTPQSHHQRSLSTNQQIGMPQTPSQSGSYQGMPQTQTQSSGYQANFNQNLHGNPQFPGAEHMMQPGYIISHQQQYPMPPSMHYPSGIVTSGHMLYQPVQPHYQASIPVYIQGGYGLQMGSPEEHGMIPSRSDTTLNRHSTYDQTGYNDSHMRHSVPTQKGLEQKKLTTPTSAGSSGSMLPWHSESSLLPGILEIKDLGKRHSKLEIMLMNLQDDVKDYDQKMNDIMIENPDFFHDENYQNYARKKRKHLQEIKELTKHKHELESSQEVQAGDIDQQNGTNETIETLKKRLSDINLSKPPSSPYFPAVASPENLRPIFQPLGPPVVSYPYPSYPPGTLTTPTVTPVNMVGTSQHYPQVLQSSGQENVPSNTSTLTSAWRPGIPQNIQNNFSGCGDHNMDEIRKMLVLDQNPHAPRPSIGNASGLDVGQVPIAYPPNIIDTSPPNVHKSGVNKTLEEKWQCEHCTLLNDTTTNICRACEKTSTRRQSGGQQPAGNSGELQQEQCEHCTSFNPVGTKVCSVCCRSQDKYQAKLRVSTSAAKLAAQHKDSQSSEGVGSPFEFVPRANETEKKSPELIAASGVGKIIDEEQDKVYLEKKQAHEEYAKRMKQQVQISNSPAPPTNQSAASKGRQSQAAIFPPEFIDYVAIQESDCSAAVMVEAAHQMTAVGPPKPSAQIAKSESLNKNLSTLKKNMEQGSNSGDEAFSSAPTSLEPLTREVTEVTYKTPPEVPDTEKGFVDTMLKLTQERDQKQVNLEGRTLFSIIKMASEEGYTVPEAELAVILDEKDPLQYLKNVWPSLIDHVAYHAAEEGKKGPQNSVGDVSAEEAKAALLACKGDLDASIKKCMDDRIVKYGMVSQQGEFAREEILTALFQHKGDVMEALDQLNHSLVKPVSDRVWNAPGEVDAGREALFGAGNQTNSISNSVIRCDDFQRLVKNKELPKERRIRMVFIEGKLKSWGRAEMVIRILDEDLKEDDGNQTWTLEDIIDAVRNCVGDHRSTLVYLNQECQLCFCLYPMSKIIKLGTCNCNMCKGCVKQNFEVAIREHHVRNWNCPLCQSPSLEDELESSSYFEFLVLLLHNLVAKEILDIFETKLRDWHLQKDPNFRWCAHCVTGFIWDQPDQLEMTCPPCREKTCFKCKKKWEDQHRGLTCEQFTQWKIDNDPERQSKGVQLYLEENGIDCPGCKMRYSLAKGGCMHFTCPQCGFQFCSGCQQAFHKDGTCKLLRSCQAKGLHCHHPRDCFYYLRDNDVPQLQKLLKNHKVAFNTDPPETQADRAHCFVMEQKESGVQKKDEACGNETSPGMAGLCSNHYKEYLVSLINKNKIDPIEIMDMDALKILIERDEKQMPPLNKNETEAAYRKRIEKFIKDKLKLHR